MNPAFTPRWHGGGLLDLSWSPPVPSQTAVPPGAAPRLERVAAPVPAPFPIPLPLPPVAIPGTPENQAFSDSVISLYKTLKKILSREYDEDCEQEWTVRLIPEAPGIQNVVTAGSGHGRNIA